MRGLDMAVVVSQAQNEIVDLQAKGLDIVPHRRRLVAEDLDAKFKDPDDPFALVFVCAMWMTGFDVPSCSTIYLDKPMRNHSLMQTIARANRVFKDKVNGLIVDYVGVFRDLQRALTIYNPEASGAPDCGEPVRSKAELVDWLRRAVSDAMAFCAARGVNQAKIEAAEGFARIKLLDDAVEALIENDDTKRQYLLLADQAVRLYRAILPDPLAGTFLPTCTLLSILAQKIRALSPPPDISAVMEAVEELLDHSIAAEGYVIRDAPAPYGSPALIDLSQIDFDALKREFAAGDPRTEAEKLRALLARKVTSLVRRNKSRLDYLARFQAMIDEYNAGTVNVQEFFAQLVHFAQELDAEDKRGLAEQLSEEELAIFDLLTKPEPSLTKQQEQAVKKVARELLATLKREKLVLDWRKRQQSRAAVRQTIDIALDELPDVYAKDLYQQKCDLTYQHIYESYFDDGHSIYDSAA
jgi:type I restriction enzyme, R subunit